MINIIRVWFTFYAFIQIMILKAKFTEYLRFFKLRLQLWQYFEFLHQVERLIFERREAVMLELCNQLRLYLVDLEQLLRIVDLIWFICDIREHIVIVYQCLTKFVFVRWNLLLLLWLVGGWIDLLSSLLQLLSFALDFF